MGLHTFAIHMIPFNKLFLSIISYQFRVCYFPNYRCFVKKKTNFWMQISDTKVLRWVCIYLLYVTKDWIKSTGVHLTEHLWSRWGLGIDFSAWAKNSHKDLWVKMHNNDSFPLVIYSEATVQQVLFEMTWMRSTWNWKGGKTHTQRKTRNYATVH